MAEHIEFFTNTQSGDGVSLHCMYDTLMAYAESPLEELFFHNLVQRGCGSFTSVIPQFEVGRRRVDLMVECESSLCRVGIELDGAAYHDADRDWYRDMEILESGLVDEIIRIPYAAAWFYPHATFAVLGEWHPEFKRYHNSTVSWAELLETVKSMTQANYASEMEAIDSIEYCVEVYKADASMGFACSPKTAFCRFSGVSKLRYIKRHLPRRVRQPGGF